MNRRTQPYWAQQTTSGSTNAKVQSIFHLQNNIVPAHQQDARKTCVEVYAQPHSTQS
jgi:hypothetical protein